MPTVGSRRARSTRRPRTRGRAPVPGTFSKSCRARLPSPRSARSSARRSHQAGSSDGSRSASVRTAWASRKEPRATWVSAAAKYDRRSRACASGLDVCAANCLAASSAWLGRPSRSAASTRRASWAVAGDLATSCGSRGRERFPYHIRHPPQSHGREPLPMSDRHRLLLSPSRLRTHHQVYLNEDEMAAWLNGFVVLWHPALLLGGEKPPRVDSAYDHEQPTPGRAYVMPESPPQFLPDDWPDRVRANGALKL